MDAASLQQPSVWMCIERGEKMQRSESMKVQCQKPKSKCNQIRSVLIQDSEVFTLVSVYFS